jgi:AraC-like DNA-binding protein
VITLEMPTAYAVMMIRDALQKGENLLSGLNISLELLESKEYFSYGDYLEILGRYTDWNDELDWGFSFGDRLGIASHGVLGFGALSAPTVGDGLALLSRYIGIRTPYTQCHLSTVKTGTAPKIVNNSRANNSGTLTDAIRLTFEIDEQVDIYRRRVCETLCMVFQTYIESTGASSTPTLWHFPFSEPENISHYARWIHGGYVFSSNQLMLEVPGSVVMVVSAFRDESVYQSSLNQCEAIFSAGEQDPVFNAVKTKLSVAYKKRVGELTPETIIPDAAAVATDLGMSKRTLMRKLSECDTTFQNIRDELLKEQIQSLIEEGKLSLAGMSHRLGYQDAGNFSRACKRLFGQSPSSLRTRLAKSHAS